MRHDVRAPVAELAQGGRLGAAVVEHVRSLWQGNLLQQGLDLVVHTINLVAVFHTVDLVLFLAAD